MAAAKFSVIPAISRGVLPMANCSETGMLLLTKMPTNEETRIRSGVSTFVVVDVESEHRWIEHNADGTTTPRSMTYVLSVRRLSIRNGSLVWESRPKELALGNGRHAQKRAAYVRRVNKKWARRGLTEKTPVYKDMRMRVGSIVLRAIVDAYREPKPMALLFPARKIPTSARPYFGTSFRSFPMEELAKPYLYLDYAYER